MGSYFLVTPVFFYYLFVCLFDCVSLAALEVCIKQAGFELTEILCLLRVEMKSMRYHTQLHFRLLNIHTLSSRGEAEAGRAWVQGQLGYIAELTASLSCLARPFQNRKKKVEEATWREGSAVKSTGVLFDRTVSIPGAHTVVPSYLWLQFQGIWCPTLVSKVTARTWHTDTRADKTPRRIK